MYKHRFSNNPIRQKIAENENAGREVSSGIIIFRKVMGEIQYLLLYYGHSQWTFPRGKIEKEERSFAAALRETEEETGLSQNDLKFIEYFKTYENWTFVKNNKKIYKTVIFYLAETNKKQIKIEERSQGYIWATYREATKIFSGPKNSENRKVITKANNFMVNRIQKPHSNLGVNTNPTPSQVNQK
jgi:8-oxo-dGTP pyrophosphatase MutT (NUDIX family)